MNDNWIEDTTDVLHCSMPPQVRAHIEELRDEVARLRDERDAFAQGCWDMAAACGMDTDGDTGPHALIAGMGAEGAVGALLRDIREFATDANRAVDEVCMTPQDHAEITRLRAAEVPLSANVGFVGFGNYDEIIADGADNDTAWPSVQAMQADRPLAKPEHIVALIPVTAWDRT